MVIPSRERLSSGQRTWSPEAAKESSFQGYPADRCVHCSHSCGCCSCYCYFYIAATAATTPALLLLLLLCHCCCWCCCCYWTWREQTWYDSGNVTWGDIVWCKKERLQHKMYCEECNVPCNITVWLLRGAIVVQYSQACNVVHRVQEPYSTTCSKYRIWENVHNRNIQHQCSTYNKNTYTHMARYRCVCRFACMHSCMHVYMYACM